jgi:hypothetical protein
MFELTEFVQKKQSEDKSCLGCQRLRRIWDNNSGTYKKDSKSGKLTNNIVYLDIIENSKD